MAGCSIAPSPAPLALPGLTVRGEPVGLALAKFDLTVSLRDRRGPDGALQGLQGRLGFRTDRFTLATMTALAARLVLSQPPDDALDPVRVAADTHRVALDNPFVRVLDVHLPPGKVEPRHRHPHGMSVYFTDWEAKVTPDGKPHPFPPLVVDRLGDSYRFLPGGKQLVVKLGGFRRQNFWFFDVASGARRQATSLAPGQALHRFDVSPDGKRIIFEVVRAQSDIAFIELAGR